MPVPLSVFLQAGYPSCRPTNSVKALKEQTVDTLHFLIVCTYNAASGCQNLINVIMVALCNRADHYIFILWFLLSICLLFLPRLISAIAEWMSAILAHMVWP